MKKFVDNHDVSKEFLAISFNNNGMGLYSNAKKLSQILSTQYLFPKLILAVTMIVEIYYSRWIIIKA